MYGHSAVNTQNMHVRPGRVNFMQRVPHIGQHSTHNTPHSFCASLATDCIFCTASKTALTHCLHCTNCTVITFIAPMAASITPTFTSVECRCRSVFNLTIVYVNMNSNSVLFYYVSLLLLQFYLAIVVKSSCSQAWWHTVVVVWWRVRGP